MDKLSWIKDLVRAEQQMEESGMVDMAPEVDPSAQLMSESMAFLNELKIEFVDALSAFNDLKPSALGRIKLYGIAKTHADFMLFRNGFKMIFSLKEAGLISVRFNYMGTNFVPALSGAQSQQAALMDEDLVEARWGAFGEVIWTYQGQTIRIPKLVEFYMSRFVRESVK